MLRSKLASPAMTPEAYRQALEGLGYTQEGFAITVGAAPRTGQKWALGEARIPGSVILLLKLLQMRPELKAVVDTLTPPTRRSRSQTKFAEAKT